MWLRDMVFNYMKPEQQQKYFSKILLLYKLSFIFVEDFPATANDAKRV